jgi:predicted GNAT family N-acyltransferase
MISNFRVFLVRSVDITPEILGKIISLKRQHWKYSIESNEKWISENLNADDHHLWIENNSGEIIAYLNLVFLNVSFDGKIKKVLGIGNVCVAINESGKGIGYLLMLICNYYIRNIDMPAILLCKKTLSKFYKKTGWKEFNGNTTIKGKDYQELVMFIESPDVATIEIEKNF